MALGWWVCGVGGTRLLRRVGQWVSNMPYVCARCAAGERAASGRLGTRARVCGWMDCFSGGGDGSTTESDTLDTRGGSGGAWHARGRMIRMRACSLVLPFLSVEEGRGCSEAICDACFSLRCVIVAVI